MVERRPLRNIFAHIVLIIGLVIVAFPVYLTFVASTSTTAEVSNGQMGLLPGPNFFRNYGKALFEGTSGTTRTPVALMLWNSFLMAMIIAVGKIAISIISAFAIVYFRFPFRALAFWLIFITLMLPVEVRILPTFKVVADLGMLNSYPGLIIPIIASATATFLFRQFFLTVPDELMEAARVDSAGPMKFFWDILVPLSRTNMAALFVILFVLGWNQYLWPLLVTTDPHYYTIVMGIKRMADVAESYPQWNLVMAAVILAMLPPVVVVIAMQRLFVKGLVETEK
jgi:sn-glycerol 3-phosphate transport system permease protein